MLSDRIFKNALVVSVILHLFLLYNWPPLNRFNILKPSNNIEVTYYATKKAPVISDLIAEKEKIKTSPAPPAEPLGVKDSSMAGKALKGTKKPIFDSKSDDKPSIKYEENKSDKAIRHISSDTKMLISHKDKDLSDEPAYLNYYNAVRSKIYALANANKPYYFIEGQVKLIFTITRDGSLLNAAIVEDGSSTNPILRNHALMSIRKAAPFPPFIASMEEDRLTMRLTISFER